MKSSDYRKLNNPLAGCEIIIGIDPGKNTGFAMYERETAKFVAMTLNFWKALDNIDTLGRCNNGHHHLIGIVIEIPPMLMYGRNRGAAESKLGVANTMSSKMGGNRREGELMAERLESLGFPVVRKTPCQTKWNAAECKRITGIELQTNEHTRDAIRLAWEHI